MAVVEARFWRLTEREDALWPARRGEEVGDGGHERSDKVLQPHALGREDDVCVLEEVEGDGEGQREREGSEARGEH